jgi:Putative stress-induced transcription regulator
LACLRGKNEFFPEPIRQLLLMDGNQSDTLCTPRASSQGFEEFMLLIEIPNAYTLIMAISATGPKRIAVIGEPIVAVDPINTVAAPGSPTAGDLLTADHGAQAWWRTEGTRVPGGDLPDIRALRRLRTALRAMIEALIDGRPVPRAAVADLNFFMQSAPASTRLLLAETGLRTEILWHREYGGIRSVRSHRPPVCSASRGPIQRQAPHADDDRPDRHAKGPKPKTDLRLRPDRLARRVVNSRAACPGAQAWGLPPRSCLCRFGWADIASAACCVHILGQLCIRGRSDGSGCIWAGIQPRADRA